MGLIKLLALDIDGCITPGEGAQADYNVLSRIRECNELSKSEPRVPAVTLCTGRQQPYVDLMTQLTGVRHPAVFENGAGLYFPDDYSFRFHPDIDNKHRAELMEFKHIVELELVASGEAYIQPGKEMSLSVYPSRISTPLVLFRRLEEIVSIYGLELYLDPTISCTNVLLGGINKGAGLRWLSDVTGIALENIGMVGDSLGDIFALVEAGFPACPANAAPEAKEKAVYVASKTNGHGTMEIIDAIIERNKNLS